MTQKELSIFWQCISTLTLPTGLFAFKKINKLGMGIISYLLSFGVMVMGIIILVMLFWNPEGSKSIFYYVGASMDWMLPVSLLLPIIYIRRYTIQYNKKIKEEAKTIS